MRYFQFTQWMENGNWYLRPLPQLNPEDGVLIHWSRLPDIPLALISLLAEWFVSPKTAYAVAICVVPGLYLFGIVIAVGKLTQRIIGTDYVVLACLYLLSTHLVTKFLPGAIDHHNLQLLFAAWFLVFYPLNHYECKSGKHAILSGLMLALSFWTGLENLIFFVLLLLFLTLRGYKHSLRYLYFCRTLCISALLFSSLFCLLNRPPEEFFIRRVDTISWSYLICLFSGIMFCHLSVSFRQPANKMIRYILLGLLSSSLIIFTTPEVIFGVYYHYPELPDRYWLSRVSEAISIFSYIKAEGLFSPKNFLLGIIPALLSIIFIIKQKKLLPIYLIMLILLLPAFFWQSRTIFLVFIIAAPFQAWFAMKCLKKTSLKLTGASIALICMPGFITIAMTMINSHLHPDQVYINSNKNNKIDIVHFLQANHLSHQKILAPIEFGAPIIALTDNAVVSAPYHRNIKGNTLAIKILTSENLSEVHRLLIENQFDYILIGHDLASKLWERLSEKNAFIRRLNKNQLPNWLSLYAQGSQGMRLYKIDLSADKNDSMSEKEKTGSY